MNEIWEQEDEQAAKTLLLEWIAYAESSGIAMLKTFAKTLRLHALGILAWYDHPISTGPLEGTNNKIKTIYGFRDPEFLKLKILGIHQTKYALVGLNLIFGATDNWPQNGAAWVMPRPGAIGRVRTLTCPKKGAHCGAEPVPKGAHIGARRCAAHGYALHRSATKPGTGIGFRPARQTPQA